MFIGVPVGGSLSRRIYVDNKTNETIENICFTFGNEKYRDSFIKKLNAKPKAVPFTRQIIQLLTGGMSGARKLVMYYYDKNNIRHEYEILDKLTSDFRDNIGVEILAVKDDGELEIKVTPHFGG